MPDIDHPILREKIEAQLTAERSADLTASQRAAIIEAVATHADVKGADQLKHPYVTEARVAIALREVEQLHSRWFEQAPSVEQLASAFEADFEKRSNAVMDNMSKGRMLEKVRAMTPDERRAAASELGLKMAALPTIAAAAPTDDDKKPKGETAMTEDNTQKPRDPAKPLSHGEVLALISPRFGRDLRADSPLEQQRLVAAWRKLNEGKAAPAISQDQRAVDMGVKDFDKLDPATRINLWRQSEARKRAAAKGETVK